MPRAIATLFSQSPLCHVATLPLIYYCHMTVSATGMRGDNPVQIPIPGKGQLYGETCDDHLMYVQCIMRMTLTLVINVFHPRAS